MPRLGPLWQAVRASSTIPGIWAPVLWDGHVLVDGAVLNNLPADLLAERCRRGKIIACDVTLYNNFGGISPEALALSGWQRLWLKYNPFKRTVKGPGIFDFVTTAGTLASLRHSNQVINEMADHYISPQASQYSTLDVASDEICYRLIKLGYEQACRQLDDMPGLI